MLKSDIIFKMNLNYSIDCYNSLNFNVFLENEY